MTTPVLKIAYPNKDFVVCTDASKEGLGEVLTQEEIMSSMIWNQQLLFMPLRFETLPGREEIYAMNRQYWVKIFIC